MSSSQRTQQQRKEETVKQLLKSATRLFGKRGYADTSLEDIAQDCALTIGAIYHHFGNKKTLFAAVNQAAEQRIIDAVKKTTGENPLRLFKNAWAATLNLCNDAGFRRIVLIDSPNVLGRDRWVDSEVVKQARALADFSPQHAREFELALRIMRGAATEAILAIAEADNAVATRRIVDAVINRLLEATTAALADNFQSAQEEK